MKIDQAIILLGAAGALLVLCAGWLLMGKRRSPSERERARRLYLSTRGRLGSGEVFDIAGSAISYRYEIAGVAYDATQDVSGFPSSFPTDPGLVLGPANIRYSVHNPANSIVISEQWSGLRVARPGTQSKPEGV